MKCLLYIHGFFVNIIFIITAERVRLVEWVLHQWRWIIFTTIIQSL